MKAVLYTGIFAAAFIGMALYGDNWKQAKGLKLSSTPKQTALFQCNGTKLG